jgi:hypothetical protein
VGKAGAAADQPGAGDRVMRSPEWRPQANGTAVEEAAAQGAEGGHFHLPGPSPATHFWTRQERADQSGRVTFRYLSRLHHIGVSRVRSTVLTLSWRRRTTVSSMQR